MIKIISAKFIEWTLRIKFHFKKNSPPIDMIHQFASAKNILIFMPNKIEHFGIALKSLVELKTKIPHWNITVVTKQEMTSLLENQLKVRIIPYTRQHLNIFGLPKEILKNELNISSYDIALDFLFNFDLLCVMLFQLSGAPIKVCFDSREKSNLYNFGIRVNALEDISKKYSAMIKYITVIGETKMQRSPLKNTS